MKKFISHTVSLKRQYVFTVLLMFLSGFTLFARQDRWEESFSISFDSPFSYTLEDNIKWELKDENEVLVLSGKGALSSYVFSKPGSYKLHIHEERDHDTGSCEHTHYPETLKILVSPVKLDFNFLKIHFSKDIVGGQPVNGIIVSVEVKYSSYNNSNKVYNQGFTSFGVGSTVSGKQRNEETILKPGINTIEFVLEGQAEAGNNIQLNFLDFNGEVQPYTVTPKAQ